MGSVRISVEELEKASNAFGEDYDSGEMDNKMHRFPAGLRDVGEQYIVPMVVAIDPYHRGSDHLQKMEEVKRAAAFHLIKVWGHEEKKLLEEVQEALLPARKHYAGEAAACMGDQEFKEMMFLDACFLLQYMDVYSCFNFNKDSRVDESLRRFLFTNRACIDNDIMLLENQLPWTVVETIIKSLKHKNYMNVVDKFIADIGNTFNLDEDVKTDTSAVDEENNDNNNSPPTPHLLGLLRRHKTEPGTEVKWPRVERISAFTAIGLAEIGIMPKASKPPALFTDMDVRRRGPFCGELSLAPLSLDETRASWLVNMAAFEVSTASTYQDHPNKTAVCSYLALLSMFMHREEDVHELRSKRILYADQTKADMLAFFKKVINLLPNHGCRFVYIMVCIEEYKKNRWMRTRVYRFVHNDLIRTIVKLISIIGTLVAIFQGLLALNQRQ